MSPLTSKRKGDLAEMHVASLLLADPELEVFTSVSDDGLGSDLAVRSARTGRWYSIQVKAATRATSPWVALNRFRNTDDFLVAAVVLDDTARPVDVYLVPGSAWEHDESGCLGRNDDGGGSGPYVEVRTTSAKHQASLEKYRYDRIMSTL